MFNTERTFGVEIEFIGCADAAQRALRELGVACERESYNHSTRTWWKITTDASVYKNRSHDGTGWELVSPILKGQEGLDELERVCKGLENAGAKINRRCGIHVHHDARDFQAETFKNLLKIYMRFENVIDSLVSPSRRGAQNTYCKTVNTTKHQTALNERTIIGIINEIDDRYRKLNLESYVTHGTVEFRQHQGSTDFTKISNWIKLTQAMVERAVDRPVRAGRDGSWEAFKDFLGCNHNPDSKVSSYSDELKGVYKFFNKRRKQLAA